MQVGPKHSVAEDGGALLWYRVRRSSELGSGGSARVKVWFGMAGCGVAQRKMRRISGVSVLACCKGGAGSIPPGTPARLSSQQAISITKMQKKLRLRRETQ